MVDLKAKPFELSEEAVQWVEATIASMSLEEKVGQLFVQMRKSLEEQAVKDTLANFHQEACAGRAVIRIRYITRTKCIRKIPKSRY